MAETKLARKASGASGSRPRSFSSASLTPGLDTADAVELESFLDQADECPKVPTSPSDSEDRVPVIRALLLILLWYAFSISLSVYNKWMFSAKGLNFPFPVLTTSLHQLVQVGLAWITLTVMGLKREKFTINEYMSQVFPCTLASSGDIGMGNLSLRFVTLSFYTMVKSSALGFVLLFSFLFGLEQPNIRLAGIIGILTIGVFMMVAGETQFHLFGFVLVISAACCSGLRWALTNLLLLGRFDVKPHPVQTIFILAPGMFVILAIFGLITEGLGSFLGSELWQSHNVFSALCITMFPGILAYCMTWCEFELLQVTGALTLAIAGICKEVATIIVSVIVFKDELSLINGCGLLVTIIAIAFYHQFRQGTAGSTTTTKTLE